MFKIHEIREIIKLVDQSSLQEFEVSGENSRIYLKRKMGVFSNIESGIGMLESAASWKPTLKWVTIRE